MKRQRDAIGRNLHDAQDVGSLRRMAGTTSLAPTQPSEKSAAATLAGVRERLTIDVTVARDYQDARRAKHDDAVELFALARSGEVSLATAPQGYRLDVEGDLAEQLRRIFAEEGVPEAPQLAYPSPVTYPSETLFPGAYVPGFSDAWRAVAATWPSHEGKGGPPGDADAFHVETHVLQKRDVFLTDDRSLRVMCDRLREKHSIPIVAMDVREYLDRRSSRPPQA